MSNPKFYIYGVPDGFDMPSGTPSDEILYYQLFYDTSKKGREMRINRKDNGETVYSYLIYNLVSSKGREGAFLGMSIAFTNNEYCNNHVALKELFEGIYNEVILKADDKDRIIDVIDGGNAVGRFCISKFDERHNMCEKIGRIIVNNVESELTKYISTINDTFDNSKEGRILTLTLETDNKSINQALHSYTWVSLSSECKTIIPTQRDDPPVKNLDLLSAHFINALANKVGNYKDFIIKGLKGLVSPSEITAKREEINRHLDTIENYVGRQPELKKLKDEYMAIYKELVDLTPPPLGGPLIESGHHSGMTIKNISKKIKPHFTKIVAVLFSILIVAAVIVVLWPSNETKPTPTKIEDTQHDERYVEKVNDVDDGLKAFDENSFKSLLANADYKTAWSMLQKVGDADKRKSLALELQNSYREWFNNELEKHQYDLKGLLELKQKITAYVDFNEDNDWHNNLLDAYINPLQEIIAKEERERQEKIARQERERQERLARERELRANGGGDDVKNTSSRGNIIKIYKADVNYQKGAAISASGNVIRCKRKDCFVVEGATLTSKDNGIEAVTKEGKVQIRVPKIGQYKVKLNQIEYTFQVSS